MVDILKLQKQTVRYEFADGVRDFQTAIWMLTMGVLAWLVWDVPQLWQGNRILAAVLMFAVPLAIGYGTHFLLNKYLRRHWLWSKIGAVKPKAWVVSPVLLFGALALALSTFALGVLATIQFHMPWLFVRALWLGIGLELSLVYFVLGRSLNIPRYVNVSIVGAILTLLFSSLPLPIGMSGLVIFGTWAIILTICGFVGLRQVLHEA
jgi:hypothetical protein